MWIIPLNLPQSSAYVPGLVESKKELAELSEALSRCAMWRSKPLLSQTWLQVWKRAWWMRPLFGRIVRLSQQSCFGTRYTASLAVIHAHPLASPGSEKEPMILDTFGRILHDTSEQLSLFGVSLKTSRDTLALGSTRYTQSWRRWVTQLRLDYTARQKQARHTSAQGSLSSPLEETGWPTVLGTAARGHNGPKFGLDLQTAVAQHWPTPHTSMECGASSRTFSPNLQTVVEGKWNTPALPRGREAYSEMKRHSPGLEVQILYPTPDAKGGESYRLRGNSQASRSLPSLAAMGLLDGQRGAEPTNTHMNHHGYACQVLYLSCAKGLGRPIRKQWEKRNKRKLRLQLNPAWVALLMGTTLGTSFFLPMATEWWSKPQH